MENIITKGKLAEALDNRIINKIKTHFNEALQDLIANRSDALSYTFNRVFLRKVRGVNLTNTMRQKIESILVNDFDFNLDDILNIQLSSDDEPCLIIDFKLTD